jgi:hypothetical protein
MDTTPNEPERTSPTGATPPIGPPAGPPVGPPVGPPTGPTASPPPSPPPFVALPPLDNELPSTSTARRTRPFLLLAIGVAAFLLVGAVVAVVVAAGSDGEPSNEVATIDGEASDPQSSGGSGTDLDRTALEDASLAYGECMREHGVDLPDPQTSQGGEGGPKFSSGGGGGNVARGPDGISEEFQAAHEECKSILEDAGALIGPPSAEEQAEMQDKLIEAAQCMRDRGHDVADPQVSSDGGVTISGGPPAADDEQFQQDFEECNAEVGLMGPRFAGGSS